MLKGKPNKDDPKVPIKRRGRPSKKKNQEQEDELEQLAQMNLNAGLEDEIEDVIKELPPVVMEATEDQALDEDPEFEEKPIVEDIEQSDIDNGGVLVLCPPPPKSWADSETKYKAGDSVVPTGLDSYNTVECWRIIAPGKDPKTYSVKKSRVLTEVVVKEAHIMLAPPETKEYVSYWDHTDPFKSIGKLKISCPSNGTKK